MYKIGLMRTTKRVYYNFTLSLSPAYKKTTNNEYKYE